jgi:hypothetical protein
MVVSTWVVAAGRLTERLHYWCLYYKQYQHCCDTLARTRVVIVAVVFVDKGMEASSTPLNVLLVPPLSHMGHTHSHHDHHPEAVPPYVRGSGTATPQNRANLRL